MRFELLIAGAQVIIAELEVIIVMFGPSHRLLLILDERNQIIIGELADNAQLLGCDVD